MDDTPASAAGRLDLTTAQLAERVRVPPGTLRMWETRYGFPSPQRLPSGHRRYGSRDVEQLREVLRLRDSGLSLSASILATRTRALSGPASIFARVRERCPDLHTVVLEQSPLLALTRAIEDEYIERGSGGVVIGSFQRARNFHAAGHRWRELARASELAVALADFDALRRSSEGIWEIPVNRDDALGREWSLLIGAPTIRGILVAWELPRADTRSEASRAFEVMLSSEPAVVHSATVAAAELVHHLAPTVAKDMLDRLGPGPAQSTRELRSAAALAHRAVEYLVGSGRAGVRAGHAT